jgi:alkylhydroperoxidase family enzyme
LGDRAVVDAVLSDFRTAPISDKEKAMFALLESVVRDAAAVEKSEVEAAVAAGWTEEAVYDAITVCSLFQFFNTWVDAMGVREMPADMNAIAGKRLAEGGYRSPE